MATEAHPEGATNGNIKRDEVEPLGEIKGPAAEIKAKPADSKHTGGDGVENGCEALAEKEELLANISTPNKLKELVHDDAEEAANDAQNGQEMSSDYEADAEEGDDARDAEGEACEDDDADEEDVDEGEDEDESQPPPKRRK